MREPIRDVVEFQANQRVCHVGGGDAFLTVSEFLRERLRWTGTKTACEEGDCGSCTVLVGQPTPQGLTYRPVNSCIRFVHQLDGCHLVTIEGLAAERQLTAVQQALVDCHGSQCGFCTPGFVLTMTAACRQAGGDHGTTPPVDWPVELAGNLCRCTGYLPILEAARPSETQVRSDEAWGQLTPQFAQRCEELRTSAFDIRGTHRAVSRRVVSPVRLDDALRWRAELPQAEVIAGATDLGVRWTKRRQAAATWLDLGRVAELRPISLSPAGSGGSAQPEAGVLDVGAMATWADLLRQAETVCPELAGLLRRFGGPQIREVGTIGGNLVNASAIADSLPFLSVLDATVELASSRGRRWVGIGEFITANHQTALRGDELLVRVRIPLPSRGEHFRLDKISRRRDLDIATITAAIRIREESGQIARAAIAVGGAGPMVCRLDRVETWLRGRTWSEATFAEAADLAAQEVSPWSDLRGSADYRRQVVRGLVRRFFHESTTVSVDGNAPSIRRLEMNPVHTPLVKSTGTTIPLDSAIGHVTGQAHFLADVPPRADELCVGFVPSPVASGRILGIDLAAARAVPGVVAVLTAADLPAARRFGVLQADEPVLADGEVLYVGQPVVIVAAESSESLERARDLVRLELAETPPILTIEQALAAQRFLGPETRLQQGDAAAEMARVPHVLQGVFHSQGQEHLYLETQAALAIPGEEGQLTIHSSTQGPTEIQRVVALTLGLGMHQVVVTNRRMGGGFGGKETQGALPAVMVALVARATGRPARIVYRRDEDGLSTGKRHAYRAEWQIGFDDDGRVRAYRVQLNSAGGAALDLSQAIMERSMFHADNAYFLEHVDIRGQVCFTNHAPATAFRGFGGPQGVAVIENALQEVATYLRGRMPRPLAAADIQVRNLYGTDGRNVTPYGQIVRQNHLPTMVDRLRTQCDYRRRLAQVEQQNATDRLWLRGLALVPIKFGLSFTAKLLNQANAQVLVYTDGTVQVSTGGTEMGQGLNTKIRQLVADVFGLPPARVQVMPTSTEKNNNTSPTAASASTDLNGAAAVAAAEIVRNRLVAWAAGRFAGSSQTAASEIEQVVCEGGWVHDRRDPARRMTFAEACAGAWADRVDLGARGFYATPGIDFNRETGKGNPFYYYAQGATVAEVRVDRFTGELSVTRVDTLIDVGRSINPGIDRGQVIGGFIQGMGWVTNECLVYDERGRLLTTGASTYKIPAVSDVPREYHLEFFPTDDAVTAIAGSKGVGEPPLLHALSVWMAAKHALSYASPEAARRLRLPATAEAILHALS